MPLRTFFLTPSGLRAEIAVLDGAPVIGRDAFGVVLRVRAAGIERKARVDIGPFAQMPESGYADVPQVAGVDSQRATLAVLAVLDHIDSNPEAWQAGVENVIISVDDEQCPRLLARPRLDDRSLRLYIARRVYDEYSRSTLNHVCWMDQFDNYLSGSDLVAFQRNAGLLTAEGYVTTVYPEHPVTALQPTARLIREMERFGGPAEDVTSERDFAGTLSAWPMLASYRQSLLIEWNRYVVARSQAELLSVFRALAPIVEAILRDILASHASKKVDGTLSTMIGDVAQRKLASRALLSKLNHIVLFSRDLTEHGGEQGEGVLRVVCENAFEVVGELAAIAK
jgi:hypothetical protein